MKKVATKVPRFYNWLQEFRWMLLVKAPLLGPWDRLGCSMLYFILCFGITQTILFALEE